ncbi:MAG: FAD-dependent oxidoreductase [Micromonosporaceae bacterium]|nr:FAD-dependent oxidoreductase [Micromonosporaceae bacterium]
MSGLHGGPVVIVGGGVIGMALAYHLTRHGYREVTVVERGRVGEGATARATGGIRQQFTAAVNARLVRRSVDFFSAFAEHTGAPLTFRQHGYLFLLSDQAQLAAFRDAVAMQNQWDIPSRMLRPDEITEVFPQVRTGDLAGASYCPTDGSASPTDATAGLFRAARAGGATVYEQRTATGLRRDRAGQVTGVETDAGALPAEAVVLAPGPWAAELGARVGVPLPVTPHRRQAFAIAPARWLHPSLPFTVDLSTGSYLHPEGAGGVIGGNDRATPPGTDTTVDWQLVESLAAALSHRIPPMADAQVVRGWAGLREMSPDDLALVGPIPHLPGLWVAVGFSGHGFMQAPAVGECLAAQLLGEPSPVDLTPLRPDRFDGSPVTAEAVRF